VKEAVAGERVGLALKGADVEELARGQVLAAEGTLQVAQAFEGKAGRTCPYYRGDIREGAQLNALIGCQFVPASVTSISGDRISVGTDRPVAWRAGDRLVLSDLSAPQGPRCVGRWTL
jgi:selenocysteine-specific translation elongation factor